MKNSPFQLPWTPENVPHAILDILRAATSAAVIATTCNRIISNRWRK